MSQRGYNDDYDYFNVDFVEESDAVYSLNRDLNLAHRIIEQTGENLFLTGKAGTGKTTFLRHLRHTSPKRMVVLAPTGVAAINAEGTTIHSFFQLPFSPFIPGKGFVDAGSKHFSFRKEKRRIIASLDLLVIDEISMVRPDVLDAVDSVLRRYRNPTLPFGGVQLLLIGDLRQLAPVMKEEEKRLLEPHYPSEYFFDSHALRQSGFVTIELSTVYRQSDPQFISVLNAVRDGMLTPRIIDRLNSRVIPDFFPDDSEGYIRLTTHNRYAEEINFRRLQEIKDKGRVYEAVVKGNFPESSYPADARMRLKVGARVMFIKNDSGNVREYYNGMLGTVTGLDTDAVIVAPSDGHPPITVRPVEWENTKYILNEDSKEIMQVTDGTFTQIPLRLAWAITIHKSQGLTFERAIIDAGASFAPGQTYVALSRCRSLEGLVLSRQIPVSAIITDAKVNSFIDDSNRNRPDEASLERMRGEYTRNILAELFNFRQLRITFDDFHRAVTEFVIPQYPEYFKPFQEARDKMTHDIDFVGAKFAALYAGAPILPEHLEAHPEILEKIKKGCDYFLAHLDDVMSVIDRLNVNISNAVHVERLTKAYETLLFQFKMKKGIFRLLAGDNFTPARYVNAKAKAVLDATSENEKGSSSAVRINKTDRRRKKTGSAVKTKPDE